MMKRSVRSVFILLVTGAFVSAAQGALSRPAEGIGSSAEGSRFDEEGMLDLSSLALEEGAPGLYSAGADTLETYDIEIEDDKSDGVNVKAVVGIAIAAAFVGYFLYTVIVPDDEEEEEDTNGKEPPISLISISF